MHIWSHFCGYVIGFVHSCFPSVQSASLPKSLCLVVCKCMNIIHCTKNTLESWSIHNDHMESIHECLSYCFNFHCHFQLSRDGGDQIRNMIKCVNIPFLMLTQLHIEQSGRGNSWHKHLHIATDSQADIAVMCEDISVNSIIISSRRWHKIQLTLFGVTSPSGMDRTKKFTMFMEIRLTLNKVLHLKDKSVHLQS